MSSFVGFTSLKNNFNSNDNLVIKNMTNSLIHRVPDKETFFVSKHTNIGFRKLVLLNSKNEEDNLTYTINDNTYTITYNGNLYNAKEIKDNLISLGHVFETSNDTEIILKAFLEYGTDILKSFNGVFSFAIWNENKKELILVRDHFGIKPLYYSLFDNTIIFSTEIKAILKYPGFEAIINKEGISELFGIGPSHTNRNLHI